MKRHLFTLTLSSVLTIPAVSHAESRGGLTNTDIHYLNWAGRITKKSPTKSHEDGSEYLELEGGANFSWGEMYRFFGWENFYNDRYDKPGSEQRYTFKNTNRIYLSDTGFNLYPRAYGTYGSASHVSFHDGMFLYGIGYNFTGSGWWFEPFSAKRYTDQTYYTSDNGHVAGQVAGYSFMLGSEKFTLTNRNEYEFNRDTTYTAGNGGKEGLNSAVALWWNATSRITTGIQHHYADDELGEDFYRGAIVYSTRFNF